MILAAHITPDIAHTQNFFCTYTLQITRAVILKSLINARTSVLSLSQPLSQNLLKSHITHNLSCNWRRNQQGDRTVCWLRSWLPHWMFYVVSESLITKPTRTAITARPRNGTDQSILRKRCWRLVHTTYGRNVYSRIPRFI